MFAQYQTNSQCGPQQNVEEELSTMYELLILQYVKDRVCNPNFCIVALEHIQQLPVPIMVDVLEEICAYPILIETLSKLLSNPMVLNRILRSPFGNEQRLTLMFLRLEAFGRDVLGELKENLCDAVEESTPLDDDHLLGFERTLHLGSFLLRAGWKREACEVLEVARKQAEARPIHLLQVLQHLLLALTALCLYEEAQESCETILELMSTQQIAPNLQAALNLTISKYHFERYQFDSSYEYGVRAFGLLDDGSCANGLFVEVFCHFSKCCIAKNQLRRGNMLIVEAVSRALSTFGPSSFQFAAVLEDYAIHLLMMNMVDKSFSVYVDVRKIFTDASRNTNLQLSRLYCVKYETYMAAHMCHNLNIAKQNVDHSISHLEQIDAVDQRILAANRSVRTLVASDMSRYGTEQSTQQFQIDEFDDISTEMALEEVRRVFDAMDNTINIE